MISASIINDKDPVLQTRVIPRSSACEIVLSLRWGCGDVILVHQPEDHSVPKQQTFGALDEGVPMYMYILNLAMYSKVKNERK